MSLSTNELYLLTEAIGSGVVLSIRYDGGSDPGSYRDIQPNKITDTMVWAFCHTSKAVKQFAISKIGSVTSVPTSASAALVWSPKTKLPEFDTLGDYYQSAISNWRSRNLNCQFSGDHDAHEIGVFENFKNGKPRKTASIAISFEKYELIHIALPNGDVVAERVGQKQKPYTVRSKGVTTVTFSRIENAIERFEERVSEL